MKNEKNTFDVAVIGGGPAGMTAAIKAAEKGASVVVLEKNKDFGRKLLLTGHGRCNITNAEFDVKNLVSRYGKGGKFLFSAFRKFGPEDVVRFFNEEKVETKVERGGRVFPKSNRAETVRTALIKCMKKRGVTLVCDAKVHRFSVRDGRIKKIILQNKKEVFAENYILCTGGSAYSVTGSTGDGVRWADSLGHSVREMKPALVPLKIKELWVRELQGLSLKNVQITAKGGKKKAVRFGECVFAHYGISGPIILDMSKEVGELLEKGKVKLFLDLKPALDFKKLDERVRRDFEKYANKKFKNSLEDLLPAKMIPVVVDLSGIVPEKKVNQIGKEERKGLVGLLKGLEMTVESLMGFDLAVTTSGGVSLSEIDEKTMQSKKIENLFFAGEVIDIDGPTGGFNLQMCWSTGYVAGEGAVKKLSQKRNEQA